MVATYLQGLSLGLAYVAPIGMQNLFVIESAMDQNLGRAMRVALVVAFWDVTLGLACFLGVGALMVAVPPLEKIILCAGGLLVIFIGFGLLRTKEEVKERKELPLSFWRIVVYAFVVTWLNPQALIDGTLMLGAFRASLPEGESAYFIMGFASASLLWFHCLSLVVHLLGKRIGKSAITWINRICGTVIILYGVKLLSNFVKLLWK